MTFVLFEKLILEGHVAKFNRKLIAGNLVWNGLIVCLACCLVLACKMTDFRDIQGLLQSLHAEFSTSSSAILRYEFPIYASLNFNMHLPQSEYLPHLHRILEESIVDAVSIEDYVGNSMYWVWKQGLMEHAISEKEEELEEEGD